MSPTMVRPDTPNIVLKTFVPTRYGEGRRLCIATKAEVLLDRIEELKSLLR